MNLLIEIKPITRHYNDTRVCKRQWIIWIMIFKGYSVTWSRAFPLTKWYKYRLCRWCDPGLDNYRSLKKFLNFCEKTITTKIFLKSKKVKNYD